MCFWCWGFAPVAEALSRQTVANGITFYLIAGGLCAGYDTTLDPDTRGYILGHWQIVQQTTGQSFRFDDALSESFVYDTELACQALVAARSFDEESAWPLVRAIRQTFYAEGHDVTQVVVLANLAEVVGVPRIGLAAALDNGEVRDATATDLAWVRDLGTAGFPTLLAERNDQLALLTNGYQPPAELSPLLGHWLERDRHE